MQGQFLARRVEMLVLDLPGGEKSLPVFSFAEEASLFVGLGAFGDTGGELARVLLGPCHGVGRVALDPLPGIGAEPLNRLASMGRERFVRFLLDREARARPGR